MHNNTNSTEDITVDQISYNWKFNNQLFIQSYKSQSRRKVTRHAKMHWWDNKIKPYGTETSKFKWEDN